MEHSQFFTSLRKLFEKFPGIGPRQANRFIWALLDFSEEEQKELVGAIATLPKHMRRCDVCFRAFTVKDSEHTCSFCGPHSRRDHGKLMVLERDSDLLNVEKAGIYHGLYHVLGGALDPLDENSIVRERIKKLYERFSPTHSISSRLNPNQNLGPTPSQKSNGLGFNTEIILALSPTKLGEFTSEYVKKILEPLTQEKKIKITRLGRGLSTGV